MMIGSVHRVTSRQSRGKNGRALRKVAWIIGIAALAMLLTYKLVPWSQGKQTISEVSKVETPVEGDKGPVSRQADVQRETEASSVSRTMTGSTQHSSGGFEGRWADARNLPHNQSASSYTNAQQLIKALAQMKPRDGKFSLEEIKEINRLLQELRWQGQAGIMAIREFLESGQDVSFANFEGKSPPEYSSLRLALIDALAQTGGPEAAAYMASMLHTTTNPEELALLAKGLEQSSPGVYRAEIMKVVRVMLDQALKASPGQYPGLGRLFGIIQDYGDASIAADLENMYRKGPSTFTEFALMALSKLPDGYGIPALLKIVNEMSGDPGAYGMTYDMALRYLAQASREYPEAGEALLRLAAANMISTSGLIQIATALGGTEYGLITKNSEFFLKSKAEMGGIRAIETWSDAEIDQRLRLIDLLLRTNPQSAAVKALEEARKRLLVWKARPIVGGKRKKQ